MASCGIFCFDADFTFALFIFGRWRQRLRSRRWASLLVVFRVLLLFSWISLIRPKKVKKVISLLGLSLLLLSARVFWQLVFLWEEKLHLFYVVGGRHSFDIYKFTRMALDAKHTRYDVPRAALQLLSKHACQFGQYLMDEYEVKGFSSFNDFFTFIVLSSIFLEGKFKTVKLC